MTEGQARTVTPLEFVGASLALAAFVFFVFQWGVEGAIHSRKTLAVPDLNGKSLSSALDVLSNPNLSIRKDGSELDSSVPISSVLRQDPAPGTVVREGKIV